MYKWSWEEPDYLNPEKFQDDGFLGDNDTLEGGMSARYNPNTDAFFERHGGGLVSFKSG